MLIAFIIIGILIFGVFAVAIFDGVLNFGNIAGMALGAVYAGLGVLIDRIDGFDRILCALLAVCALLLIVLKMREIYAAGKTTAGDEKVIIVLGCRVKGDKPSRALVKRTDAAYKFLLRNPDSVAILSGGQGRDENISEAECMQNLLYERGILKDRLILEDRSTSTDENIKFSVEIMQSIGAENRVAIATSDYHQKRAALICRRYGLKSSVISSKTKPTLLPTFLLREIFATAKEHMIK